MRALALGGIVGPVLFTLATLIAGGLREDYSHLHQFISELGATGTSHSALMNLGGFIPTGMLLMAFALSTRVLQPRTRLASTGGVLLLIFGAGVVTAGFASCDVGCPQGTGSLSNMIHDRVSPLAFVAAIAGVAMFSLHFRSVDHRRFPWGFSAVIALLSAAFMGALVVSLESREYTGLWQRLLLGSLFSWCVAMGFRVRRSRSCPATLRRTRPPPPPGSPTSARGSFLSEATSPRPPGGRSRWPSS